MNRKRNSGFIKTVLVVIAGLVLLKYLYDFDVINMLTQGKFKMIIDKIYEVGSYGWQKYQDTLIRIFKYIFSLIKK